MDQPTEPISSHDSPNRPDDLRFTRSKWRPLPQRAMRAVDVVIIRVLGQYRSQLPASQDQHPIEQLTPYRAHPPLRVRIRPWCPHRCDEHPDPPIGKYRFERSGDLRIPIADQQPESTDAVSEPHDQVAGLLRHPLPHRMRRHTQHVDPASRHLDDKQHLQLLQQHRVRCEEVYGQYTSGLGLEELPPGEGRPLWCRRNAGALQDGPHRAGPDLQSKAAQLTVDPAVAPKSGSPWPAATPVHGSPPPHSDGHAGADKSSGVGPGPDATAAACPAVQTTRPRLGVAAAAQAQPAPPGQPIRSTAGRPAAAALRPRGATRAAQRPWLPNSAPAAQTISSLGRTADRSVARPCADHRWQVTCMANSQLSTYDRLSGTHRAGAAALGGDHREGGHGAGQAARRRGAELTLRHCRRTRPRCDRSLRFDGPLLSRPRRGQQPPQQVTWSRPITAPAASFQTRIASGVGSSSTWQSFRLK